MYPLPTAKPRLAPFLFDELLLPAGRLSEGPELPLVSAGIPVGDGAGPTLDNSLHPDAAAARRAAQAEADRLNATTARVAGERYRYSVAHHAAKQPRDASHYHVINRAGKQVSGHFFYGRQPTVVRKQDRPQPPKYDATTNYPAPEGSDHSYSQYRTEWHESRANKATGRQQRRLRKGYELVLSGELELGAACPSPGPARPMLRLGAQGPYVRYLQCRLNYQHANLPVPLVEDGIWGPRTQAAVRSFQQSRRLAADAVVGPLTWTQLDAGSAGPNTVPPHPQPQSGIPWTGSTDLALVRFRNAADINAFFRARTGQDFVDWFRARVGGRGAWARNAQGKAQAVTMPPGSDVKAGFQQLWDGIPLVFKTPDISFAQFAALQSVVLNETGGQMRPITEGELSARWRPNIDYFFNAGGKSSYNVKPKDERKNTQTAGALFRDQLFIKAHGHKALGNQLAGTRDPRWDGQVYPAGYPTSPDPAVTGSVQEADFYKFRGRGYIQITWRYAYRWLVPSVQQYGGPDPVIRRYQTQWQGQGVDDVATRSSNADWDALFQQSPTFTLGALKIFFRHKKDSINQVSIERVLANDWDSVRAVACDVLCTKNYVELFTQRVRQIFDTLGTAPVAGPPPGGGALPMPGGGAQPFPGGSNPPPRPAPGPGESAQREAIIASALRMMDAPPIQAKVRGADGFRQGWQKLKAIFELAAPVFIRPGWEENNLKRSLLVGERGIPHWCGIFAVWAHKMAGVPVGNWPIGGGASTTRGFRPVPPSQLKRGDVGYIDKPYQHHFLVLGVNGDGTIDTLNGNSDPNSTISLKRRVPIRSINNFYTAF